MMERQTQDPQEQGLFGRLRPSSGTGSAGPDRCITRAWRSCGSSSGRRWRHFLTLIWVVFRAFPGSGFGSSCRRLAAPSASSCSPPRRSRRSGGSFACVCRIRPRRCDGSTAISGLSHRPATAVTDRLAVTQSDPMSAALWQAHIERALARGSQSARRLADAAARRPRSDRLARTGRRSSDRDILFRRRRSQPPDRRRLQLAGSGRHPRIIGSTPGSRRRLTRRGRR